MTKKKDTHQDDFNEGFDSFEFDDDLELHDEAHDDLHSGVSESDPHAEEEAGSSTSPKKKGGLNIKDKLIDFAKEHVIYIVGLVILIIVLYFLWGDIFPSRSQPAPQPASQAVSHNFGGVEAPVVSSQKTDNAAKAPAQAGLSKAALEKVQKAMQAENVSLLKSVAQQVAKSESALGEKVDNLQQFVSDSTKGTLEYQKAQANRMEALSQKVDSLSKTTQQLNQKLDQYNKNLETISNALTKTQGELKLVLAEKTQSMEKYTLRAVVPNQAWLINGEGQTVTVSKGATLGNYGKVTKIDSNAGKVYMSSGYVFN